MLIRPRTHASRNCATAEDIVPKGFDTVVRLNLRGTWLMTHTVATKAMIPAGGGGSRVIVSGPTMLDDMQLTGDGKTMTTDGPFAETREQLGGFYLIEARDLNEAIRLASKMPPARLGSIEVRPIKEYPSQ